MNDKARPIFMLMAEDDQEDQVLVNKAFKEARLANELLMVNDGVELLECLRKEGQFKNVRRPDIILLDLNMPRMDGREAMKVIKSEPELRSIPVIVLTTSSAEEDILRSYDLGVNSYIEKPVTFDKLVEVVKEMGHYWLEIVKLPPVRG